MKLEPDFETFARGWDAGHNQVVHTRLAADLDTPVSVMLKLAEARTDSFMLESVTGGEVRGRYSVVGLKPDLIWQCHGTQARLNREARFDATAFVDDPAAPLDSLRALIGESRIELPADLPAIAAGLYGYLGYDMIRLVEHLPDVNPDPLGLPDAVLMRPSVVAVLDGVKGEVTLVAPAWVASGLTARAAYAQAAERVMDALRDLDRPAAMPRDLGETAAVGAPVSNFTQQGYMAAVNRAKDYIQAGDIFQVVPSQRWAVPFSLPPFALYRSLRRTNPSPFMFFFNFGGFQVVGASPEILVRLREGEVTIRPIAGTRKRGTNEDEDRALEADLLGDPKERAEHLMLLDLGRNDVGRVARAGTVSGAPKVRAMQIIDELEPEKRGVYGGGVGYFAANGDMDMCIALRTGVIKDDTLYIQAGGGVVYDSDPAAEFEETVNKSNALRRAAADAGLFARRGNA